MELTTLHLEEGINDQNILKAVLLAGGPGSGKSFVVKEVIGKSGPVTGLGVIAISSDEFFERRLEKAQLPKLIDPKKPLLYAQQMQERDIAKAITTTKLQNVLNGMLPILIDGTGKSASKIIKQKIALEAIGYDVGMVFVNTSLKVALERNDKRTRTLSEKIVTDAWDDVQRNKAAFKAAFGSNFIEVANDKFLEGSELQQFKTKMFKAGKKFYEAPLKNKEGKVLLDIMDAVGAKTISDLQLKGREASVKGVGV